MVEILESCLVAPSEETPKHGLWLSNLDLAAARGHTPTVYFYRPSGDHNFFSVEAVKAALSKALVPFYPLAGRLDVGRDGRVEIDCNAEGALFVAARCDYTVDSFREFEPSPETRRLFVPTADSADAPLVVLQ
ncbi:Shikimate O-hydroxycinnamoyltransferase, partial [Ananas comosus]